MIPHLRKKCRSDRVQISQRCSWKNWARSRIRWNQNSITVDLAVRKIKDQRVENAWLQNRNGRKISWVLTLQEYLQVPLHPSLTSDKPLLKPVARSLPQLGQMPLWWILRPSGSGSKRKVLRVLEHLRQTEIWLQASCKRPQKPLQTRTSIQK